MVASINKIKFLLSFIFIVTIYANDNYIDVITTNDLHGSIAPQKAWFMNSVRESNATFRVLISPTPMLGPYNEGEIDNHTNIEGFFHEGEEIREFLSSQDNMLVISGDRHYQYVIEDSLTGIREYATGPSTDAHARGWNASDIRPEHRYLNIVGGFLSATAERLEGRPTLTLRHHDVDGLILNEDIHVAE